MEAKRKGELSDDQTTSDDLIIVCKKVEIMNLIEEPRPLDARELERARRDLEGIVELSAANIKQQENKNIKPIRGNSRGG